VTLLEASITAAAVTLVGLIVTALYRRATRAARHAGKHLAALARLPDALDNLDTTVARLAADHDARITHLEILNGVTR
jgi:hypothetical protein